MFWHPDGFAAVHLQSWLIYATIMARRCLSMKHMGATSALWPRACRTDTQQQQQQLPQHPQQLPALASPQDPNPSIQMCRLQAQTSQVAGHRFQLSLCQLSMLVLTW
jgi:hypothetical protein